MTIEDLERGMKLLWDEQVHSSGRLDRIEKIQERTSQEIAAVFQGMSQIHETLGVMRDAEISLMKTTTTLAHRMNDLADTVGDLAEAQKRTDATVSILATNVQMLAEDLQALTRRVDSFIAALGNGRGSEE